jgi:predicted Fe-S protein YdhL (DUF1289 family)
MDARSGLCAGCLRTIEEIAAWSTMSDEAKRSVWLLVEQRQPVVPLFSTPQA